MPEGGRLLAARYRLLSTVGRGGMGTVWHAHDEALDRDVAVKEVHLNRGLSDHERDISHKRTLREARTAARLSHPGVVTVYDVVEEDGRPWIVMELVRARSLNQIMETEGPLSTGRVSDIGRQLLSALRAAHQAGILHRDVKPSNVLITDTDRAVLTDFGIATSKGEATLTQTGLVMGSPAYIAPERARGGKAQPASDLWSLGVTLYAALEGCSPFERAEPLASMLAVITDEPKPSHSAGTLWPLLEGLLQKDPTQRLTAPQAAALLEQVTWGYSLAASAKLRDTKPLGRVAEQATEVVPAAASAFARITPAPPVPAAPPAADAEDPVPGQDGNAERTVIEPADIAPTEAVPESDAAATRAAPTDIVPTTAVPEADAADAAPETETVLESAATATEAVPEAAAEAAAETVSESPTETIPESDAAESTETVDPGSTETEIDEVAAPSTEATAGATANAEPTAGPAATVTADDTVATEAEPTADAEPAPTAEPTADAEPAATADTQEPARPGTAADATAPSASGTAGPSTQDTPGEPAAESYGKRTLAAAGAAITTATARTAGLTSTALRRAPRVSAITGVLARMPASTATVRSRLAGASRGWGEKGGQLVRQAKTAPPRSLIRNGLIAVAVATLLVIVGWTVLGPHDTTAASAPDPTRRPSAPPSESTGTPSEKAADVPAGFRKYKDRTGFSVAVPKDWTGPTRKSAGVFFYSPDQRSYLQIAQSRDPRPDALADWRQQERATRSSFRGYQRIRLAKVDYKNSSTAADWEFTWSSDSGRMHILDRGFVRGDHGYALLIAAPDSGWDQSIERLQPIFDTFTGAKR